jgi:hypothetical protein
MVIFPTETDLYIQKVAIVNGLRKVSMAKPARPPTNSPHCFLTNMASVPGRIALGRMDIECLIRSVKRLKDCLGVAP